MRLRQGPNEYASWRYIKYVARGGKRLLSLEVWMGRDVTMARRRGMAFPDITGGRRAVAKGDCL